MVERRTLRCERFLACKLPLSCSSVRSSVRSMRSCSTASASCWCPACEAHCRLGQPSTDSAVRTHSDSAFRFSVRRPSHLSSSVAGSKIAVFFMGYAGSLSVPLCIV